MYSFRTISRLILTILVLLLNKAMLFSSPISMPVNNVTIRSMAIDQSGTLWVATFGKGLWKIQNDIATQVYDAKIKQPYSMINHIAISQNQLWIATAGKGCVAYNLETQCFDIIPKINGFDRLHGFIKTSTNKVLIGSVGSGSAILTDNKWEVVNKNPPSSRQWVNCFIEWDNKLWIGTSTDLYSVAIDKISKNWRPISKRIRNGINTLLPKQNSLFIGTTSNGVYVLNSNKKLKHLKNTFGSIFQIVKWKNALWACGQFGLWALSDNIPTLVENYKFKTPKSLVVDKNDNLIIGTIDGKILMTSDGKTFTKVMEITKKGLERTSK